MGGDVKVKSLYGVGSTFTATIRQAVAENCPPIGVFSDREMVRPRSAHINFIAPDFSVLVVDDVVTNLSVTKGLLGPYRVKVDTCTSGAEALSLVQERVYDLVFMDHMMPDMDGIETVAAIRALGGRFEKLPIAALTANVVVGMKEIFQQNGFDDFLPKPVEMAKLHDLIERWIPIEKRVYIDRRVVSLRQLDTERRSLAEKRQMAEKKLMTEVGGGGAEKDGLSAAQTPSGRWRLVRNMVSGTTELTDLKEVADGIEGIEGLDTERGLMSAGGSPSAYKEILRLFCRDVYSRIDFLNTPSAERDINSFVTHVHALKSASASIGAMSLAEDAKALEEAGKQRDMAAVRQGVGPFRDRVAKMTERVTAALPPDTQGGRHTSKKSRLQVITPLLFRLKKALGDGDRDVIDALFEELLNSPLDDDARKDLSRASELASSSEYAEAANVIEGVMGQ
jgi:CheY-like chemotaxis protein/HPt (histidine-containing phosphotransfer) domain-containing protein